MSFSPVEKLSVTHELDEFDCGNTVLNDWLKRFALTNLRSDAAQTYVTCQAGTRKVVGYYALAAGSAEQEAAPSRISRGLARHPLPVVILARLAVDQASAGRGLGSALLRDALLRINGAADTIGVRAVLVHAKDDAARNFYEHFGFEPSPVDPLQLFLLMKSLRSGVARAARRQNRELAEETLRLADKIRQHGGLAEHKPAPPLPHYLTEEGARQLREEEDQ